MKLFIVSRFLQIVSQNRASISTNRVSIFVEPKARKHAQNRVPISPNCAMIFDQSSIINFETILNNFKPAQRDMNETILDSSILDILTSPRL
jgi:ABC-type phosphate/phosphonate transport system ATPase subunit